MDAFIHTYGAAITFLIVGLTSIWQGVRIYNLSNELDYERESWVIRIGTDGKSSWATSTILDPRIAATMEPLIEELAYQLLVQTNQMNKEMTH